MVEEAPVRGVVGVEWDEFIHLENDRGGSLSDDKGDGPFDKESYVRTKGK